MVQLTRLAAPLLNSAPPRPELPSPPPPPFPPIVASWPAVPAGPAGSAGDDITGKRAAGDPQRAQVADRGAVGAAASTSSIAVQTECRSLLRGRRTAVSTRCGIAAKRGPIGRQRALVENRPAGTFAARKPASPGQDAARRRRSRSCPPRCRGPASPCRYCEWRPQNPGHHFQLLTCLERRPTGGPVAHESARSQIHLSGLITDGPAVHLGWPKSDPVDGVCAVLPAKEQLAGIHGPAAIEDGPATGLRDQVSLLPDGGGVRPKGTPVRLTVPPRFRMAEPPRLGRRRSSS